MRLARAAQAAVARRRPVDLAARELAVERFATGHATIQMTMRDAHLSPALGTR
jgi:hypothetical protein